jgi:hypothetical protein
MFGLHFAGIFVYAVKIQQLIQNAATISAVSRFSLSCLQEPLVDSINNQPESIKLSNSWSSSPTN